MISENYFPPGPPSQTPPPPRKSSQPDYCTTGHCWSFAQPACGHWVYLPIVDWLPVQISGVQVGVTFANYFTCLTDQGWAVQWRNMLGAGSGRSFLSMPGAYKGDGDVG